MRLVLTETAAQAGAAAVTGLQYAFATVNEWHNDDGRLSERRTALLAWVKTAAGPVLLGTAADGEPSSLPAALAWEGLPAPNGRLSAPPDDWRDRPLVLHPAAAAVLVTGMASSLASRSGRAAAEKLADRRVLSWLTLLDAPAIPPGYDRDDLGNPARKTALVVDGRIRPPSPLRAGIPLGHAVFNHDTGTFTAPQTPRLELEGQMVTVPPHALELVWCLGGLQRYHADGTVRLQCFSRVAELPGSWFSVRLRGKPVPLLLQARGLAGPRTTVHSDSDVTTRSLVLASAAELEGAGHAAVTVITP
ncbi:hypothetical protein OHA27_36970 [Streptomyces sp. NBC_01619]|uniref:hypothetical protein n=1 Tax=Streptomyces sp. NBC_01619 TaxID=2975901 RepID=UPI00224F597F|nr:hypothetical protein [Streptomyces sp. NBC_01619]MCX4515757.1 hypothetical protein [Streptomyces sp. NBC_01619]